MSNIATIKRRALALTGAPAPGDARAVSRVVVELCEHVEVVEKALGELIRQVEEGREQLELLSKEVERWDKGAGA